MPETLLNLAVCIPTYRRPQLLRQLLHDLGRQTVSIDRLIIVDGDPASGEVPRTVAAALYRARELCYVPSNHANLPYQRFLGWKAAAGAKSLLYLDDDLRLLHPELHRAADPPAARRPGTSGGNHGRIRRLVSETERRRERFPPRSGGRSPPDEAGAPLRKLAPDCAGELSPAGHRRPPVDRNKPYAVVGCLRGGAMAYRMNAITPECFCDALFAMSEHGWGLGEDTLLSRRIGSRGVLLTAFRAGFVHPEGDRTVAYRRTAFGGGYATAYSRRLLNDHYRGFKPPCGADRLALAQSYSANALLAWLHALSRADARAGAFASGYTLGAVRGLLQGPTSGRLCPRIDWQADAEIALSQARTLTASPAWLP